MAFSYPRPHAEVWVPDAEPLPIALARTTDLGIVAHQDDLEFAALAPIAACRDDLDRWFAGVTCTDGAGSARGATTAGIDDAELVARRRDEQRAAARVGGYGLQVQLGHRSADVRDPESREVLVAELARIIDAARPSVIVGHDPLDRHATHAAVALATVHACRSLPPASRPERLLGVEGWRSLDWLPPADRVRLDVSGHDRLVQALLDCFPSQLEGKRYDRAAVGRRHGNATFDDQTTLDVAEQVGLAVDLSPLLADDSVGVEAFLADLLERTRVESMATLRSVLGTEG